MISVYDNNYVSLENKKTVLVGGCFDIIHYGHFRFLKQARALGNYLIVALESDKTLVKTKNRPLFHNQVQRSEILEGLRSVNEVLLLPPMTSDHAYFDLVQRINPMIIALTQGDPQTQNKQMQAQNVGAACVSIPFETGFSTTNILTACKGN